MGYPCPRQVCLSANLHALFLIERLVLGLMVREGRISQMAWLPISQQAGSEAFALIRD